MSDDPTRTAAPGPDGGPAATLTDPGRPAAAPPGAGPAPPSARYELAGEIARGGMGVVYRAADAVLAREVAVKALSDRYPPGSPAALRFAEEARITGQLQHPGIPAVHDLGTLPDGRPFLAMKLIKGDTLEELLAARPDPAHDRGRFVAVFEQVCQAVGYAHAHGVVHRDLKPANVMVGAFGEVQVMDWGLAKVLADAPAAAADPDETAGGTAIVSLRDSDGSYTQAGSVLGTPAFMPPEQAAGAAGKVDARSDVFGLGGVLAVVLTGKPPFAASSAETTRVKAATGDVADCFARLDGCGADPGLVELCKRCLAPRREDRPADAGEVARAVAGLRQAADERARQAELERVRAEGERARAAAEAREQRKRRRAQAALGLAFTALLVLAGAFAWWAEDQRRARRDEAERGVNRAVEDAVARFARARGAGRDPSLWAEARAAALQAEDRAEAAGAPAEVRDRVRGLLADIDQAERNRRLAAALLEVHAGMGDRATPEGNQDFAGADARYARAFREYGTDLLAVPPEEGAELLRGLGGDFRVELAAAIDDWAYVRFFLTRKYGDTARLFRVTRLLDPDPVRDRVRDLVAAGDRAGLSRLAGEIDPAAQPVQTVNLVAVFLYWTQLREGPQAAGRFLRRAQPHHPGDFQIDHNLAFFLLGEGRPAEALPFAAAAVAVRPGSVAAWFDTARALEDLGRRAEAADAYRRIAALQPTAVFAYRRLAHVLAAAGDREGAAAARDAVRSARDAVRLDPASAPARRELAGALIGLGDWEGGSRSTGRPSASTPGRPCRTTTWPGCWRPARTERGTVRARSSTPPGRASCPAGGRRGSWAPWGRPTPRPGTSPRRPSTSGRPCPTRPTRRSTGSGAGSGWRCTRRAGRTATRRSSPVRSPRHRGRPADLPALPRRCVRGRSHPAPATSRQTATGAGLPRRPIRLTVPASTTSLPDSGRPALAHYATSTPKPPCPTPIPCGFLQDFSELAKRAKFGKMPVFAGVF